MPSTTPTSDLTTNTIRVKLVKDKHGGLGFLVKQRKLKPFVLVANIVSGGVAEESGLVQVGDIILRINDIDLTDMSYASAVEVLKAVPLDTPVVMLLRGPEGYTTYLQTSFQENGLPKTIRVTKPVQETLMGRLKKTFTGSSGPMSPVKSIKKFCNGETEKMDKLNDKDTGGGGEKASHGSNCVVSVEELDEVTRSKMCSHVGNGGVVGVTIAGQKTGSDGSVVTDDSPTKESKSGAIADKSKFLFSREGRVESQEETVLDNGAVGSPKIVLTSPKSNNKDGQASLPRSEAGRNGNNNNNGTDGSNNHQHHGHRKAIEIVQDDDKIMVVVRGDISVRNEEFTENGSTTSSTIIVNTNPNSSNNNNTKSNGGDNHASDQQDGSDRNSGSSASKKENGSDSSTAKTHSNHNGGKSNGHSESTNGGRTSRRNSGRASPRRGRSPVTSPTCMWRAGDASDEEGGTPRGRRLEKKR